VLRIDGYEHAVTVVSPLGIDQLRELDWYFEQHLRFPFTDQVRARQAGESITAYGEGLFGQLVCRQPGARGLRRAEGPQVLRNMARLMVVDAR
jgi:hypothetical protein